MSVSLRVRVCFTLLALSCSNAAFAQFSVEVRDAKSLRLIEAKIIVEEGGEEFEVGQSTSDGPFKSDASCVGKRISAIPLLSFYYQESPDAERWQKCESLVRIKFKPIRFVSDDIANPLAATYQMTSEAVASDPDARGALKHFELELREGNLKTVSVAAKELAEQLDRLEQSGLSEIYWAWAAQSAVSAISIDINGNTDQPWLMRQRGSYALTPEARTMIRIYQADRGLLPVGQLGPATFSVLEAEGERVESHKERSFEPASVKYD